MLGHKLFQDFIRENQWITFATVRSNENLSQWYTTEQLQHTISGVDAYRIETVYKAIDTVKPDVVINCIGIIKQLPEAKDAIKSITVNALFPHLLAAYCKQAHARLIHISTDCVFNGQKGNYLESDASNATDLYGKTKQMGEVIDDINTITLRTSVIGHELKNHFSLIDWFLAQDQTVRGYSGAIYTGFPTIEFSRIIKEFVIPQKGLYGLYHVSSEQISKYDLLKYVSESYDHRVEIVPYNDFIDKKSLNSDRFQQATGYKAPSWPELIKNMHKDYENTLKENEYGYEGYDHRRYKTRNY